MNKSARVFERKLKLYNALEGEMINSKMNNRYNCLGCIYNNEKYKCLIRGGGITGCLTIWTWARNIMAEGHCPITILPHNLETVKMIKSIMKHEKIKQKSK